MQEELKKKKGELTELRKKLKEAEKEKAHLGKKLGQVTKRLLLERTKVKSGSTSVAPVVVSVWPVPRIRIFARGWQRPICVCFTARASRGAEGTRTRTSCVEPSTCGKVSNTNNRFDSMLNKCNTIETMCQFESLASCRHAL